MLVFVDFDVKEKSLKIRIPANPLETANKIMTENLEKQRTNFYFAGLIMIEIKRLDHIQLCIPVGMENEARHFYAEILGLQEIAKPKELIDNAGDLVFGR